MRRYTLTFLQDETPVAQLILDVRIDHSVEKSQWRGDERIRDAIAPTLPKEGQRGYTTWHLRTLRGAESLGLTLAYAYEGEGFGEYDHYYAPDDPTGPAYR